MNRYEELYQHIDGISEEEILSIKSTLIQDGLNWQVYYWGVKCVIDADSEFDALFITDALKSAIRYGLTLKDEPVKYLEVLKILSSTYYQLNEYDLVVNQLQSICSNGKDIPDWVFHNLVAAMIHTNSLSYILEYPEMPLEYLSKNDDQSEKTFIRQKNIFKLLLEYSIPLVEGETCTVNLPKLEEAANTYEYENTELWQKFISAVNHVPYIPKFEKEAEPDRTNDTSVIIIPSFTEISESQKPGRIKQLTAQLAEKEAEINKLKQELTERDSCIIQAEENAANLQEDITFEFS